MARKARYYLGRVSKLGRLNDDLLIDAIREPSESESYGAHFTFTEIFHSPEPEFIFAHLSKFVPEGEVPVVRLEEHAEDMDPIHGLRLASSPFVYIPEFSGIAYQHVWNKLERSTFERVFPQLVEEKYDEFMVSCAIEALSDLRTFVQRIAAMDRVEAIRTRIHPSNPRFSPLWRRLRDYLERRQASEVKIEEEGQPEKALKTDLPNFARNFDEPQEGDTTGLPNGAEPEGVEIGDAAVLMAADGYGSAAVEGTESGRRVIVRTKETQMAFKFDRSPDPDEFYEVARGRFLRESRKRGLGH